MPLLNFYKSVPKLENKPADTIAVNPLQTAIVTHETIRKPCSFGHQSAAFTNATLLPALPGRIYILRNMYFKTANFAADDLNDLVNLQWKDYFTSADITISNRLTGGVANENLTQYPILGSMTRPGTAVILGSTGAKIGRIDVFFEYEELETDG